MLDVVGGFIQELRAAGLPVSLTENLDAMEAVRQIPLEDREAFKYALAATLVKNHAHWKAFETVFEVYFSLRRPGPGEDSDLAAELDAANLKPDESGAAGGGAMDSLSPEELAEMLYRALLNADEATMQALARQAVTRYAGMEPGRPVGGTYYLYRTLRNLDLDGTLERLMEASREEAGGELTSLEERLERDEYQERIARLRQEIEAEIRRRPVAAFARFTLMFVYAIAAQFSRVRAFVFIDGIDEVTRFFEGTEDVNQAVHRVNTEADVIWVDGHSDYGHAFQVFWDRWGAEMSPKSSVILLGDARNNYHASQAWIVKELRQRARHVYWLNPEPRSYWDTGDSIVSEYGIHCDGVYECRNLRQLERFVEQLR